jgi:hypothetical protein
MPKRIQLPDDFYKHDFKQLPIPINKAASSPALWAALALPVAM